MNFLGSFLIWGSGVATVHPPHGFTSTNICSIENYNNRCLEYVVECHAHFQSSWESYAHRDQQITRVGYAVPKPRRWLMSSSGLGAGFTLNQLWAHYHTWNFPKILKPCWIEIIRLAKHSRFEHEQSKLLSKWLERTTHDHITGA